MNLVTLESVMFWMGDMWVCPGGLWFKPSDEEMKRRYDFFTSYGWLGVMSFCF